MKEFYTKHKMKILVFGAFVIGVIVLLTLSFGDGVYVVN